MRGTLVDIGFAENLCDICSFTRERNGSIDRILVYVDDLFINSDAESALDEIDKKLIDKYGGVTSKKGLIHEYLGIKWDFTVKGEVVPVYSPELSMEKREMFHSITMTLHYLAKRVRPDILTAVSWCASRVMKPTEDDERKLDRILGYLRGTMERDTVLRIGDSFELRAYVDASYAVYQDASPLQVLSSC